MSSGIPKLYILFHLSREKNTSVQIQTTFLSLQQQPSYSSIFYVPTADILLHFFSLDATLTEKRLPSSGPWCVFNFSSDIFAAWNGECEHSQERSRNTFYICISRKTLTKFSSMFGPSWALYQEKGTSKCNLVIFGQTFLNTVCSFH